MSIKSRLANNRKKLKKIVEAKQKVFFEPSPDSYPYDIKEFFVTHLKILTKTGEIIPFIPNKHQCHIIEIVQEWVDKNVIEIQPTLTIQVLKSRQIGCSTVSEGIMFYFAVRNKNFNSLIVAHDGGTSQTLSDMCNRFVQYMPNPPMVRPSRGKGVKLENPTQNREIFKNHPGHQSRIDTGTSLDRNTGSGKTYRALHLSEISKWRDAETVKVEDTMTSILNTVPKIGAIIIMESTAFGMGYWYDLCIKAMRGGTKYKFVFIPWFDHDEYFLPFKSDNEKDDFIKSITQEEQDLIESYNVTLEQLNWRRDIIDNTLHGSLDKFRQEYPSNAMEAFLTSGYPVFDRVKLDARRKMLEERYEKQPPKIGFLVEDDNGGVRFVEDKNGYLMIYRKPDKGFPYCIGSDIGDGVELDYSTASVGDNTNRRQVAVMRSNTIIPTDWRAEVIKLARYYNNAYICAENNRGNVSNELWNDGYFNLYKPRDKEDSFRKKTKTKLAKTGFTTTEHTKYRVIDVVRDIVHKHPELIVDIDTIDEMMAFVFMGKGNKKMGAQVNCTDDLVIAYALMVEMMDCGQQRDTIPDWAIASGYEVADNAEKSLTKEAIQRAIEKLRSEKKISEVKVQEEMPERKVKSNPLRDYYREMYNKAEKLKKG